MREVKIKSAALSDEGERERDSNTEQDLIRE